MKSKLIKWLLAVAGISGVVVTFMIAFSSSPARAQVCVLPPSGLISWWDADAVTGTTAFDIRGTNDGTMVGGVGIVAGQVGNAFSLDGGDDFISVPDSADQKPPSLTIEGWFFFTSAQQSVLASKYQPPGIFIGWILFMDGQRRPSFSVHRPNIVGGSGSTLAVALNTWAHIAGTYDADSGEVSMYVNGVFSGSNVFAGGYQPATTPMKIGTASWFSGFFTPGLVDEFELHDRALSATEIQAIFNAGSAGKCKEEVGDTDNEEIDISFVEVSNDGTTLSCMLFIATDNPLLNKSTFRCHIDFDDEESEALARQGAGCDANDDADTIDTYRLGSNHTGAGPFCTTSDITMTYRPSKRGGKCTGLLSINCEEQEFNSSGAFVDFDCDGSAGADGFCKINITGELAEIATVWDAQCGEEVGTGDDDECLTTVADRTGVGEFDVFMFFDAQRKGDRDRLPDTSPDTTKPDEEGEVVIVTLPDGP